MASEREENAGGTYRFIEMDDGYPVYRVSKKLYFQITYRFSVMD